MRQYIDLKEMKRDVTKIAKAVSSLLSELDKYDKEIDKVDWQNKFIGHFNRSFRSEGLIRYFQILSSLQEYTMSFYSMLQQLNDWSLKDDSLRYKKLTAKLKELLNIVEDKITLGLSKCCGIKNNAITKYLLTVTDLLECLDTSAISDGDRQLCNAYYLYNVDVGGYTYPIITILLYQIKNVLYLSFNKKRSFPFVDYGELKSVSKNKVLSTIKEIFKNEKVVSPLTEGYKLDGDELILKTKMPIPSKCKPYIEVHKPFRLRLKPNTLLSDDTISLLSKAWKVPEDVIVNWAN